MARRNAPATVEDLLQVALDQRLELREGWFSRANKILIMELGATYLGRRNAKQFAVAQCIRQITYLDDENVTQWLYRIWGKTKLSQALRKDPYVIASLSFRHMSAGELAFFPGTATSDRVKDGDWPIALDGQHNKGAFGERADYRGSSMGDPMTILEGLELIGVTHVVPCGAVVQNPADDPADDPLAIYLGDRGSIPGIGREEGRRVRDGITKYTSPHGSVRYVRYVGGDPVAALQVVTMDGRTATIANAYTAPERRRAGHATALLQRAREDFARVDHAKDESLSEEGRAWRDGARTMRLGDLPRDMREELFNLHATSVDPGATQRAFDDRRVPVVELEVAGIDVGNYTRAGLERYDPLRLPPVVIAAGKLVDGGHRVAAAQHRRIRAIKAIDLTGLLDPDTTGFVAELPSPNPGEDPLAVADYEAADWLQAQARRGVFFGPRKVFLSTIPGLDLRNGDHRRVLLAMHRDGLVQLARADLVAAMDPKLVQASELDAGGAVFHFLVV